MNLKKPTLQGKIARLKINFVNQLPVRLEQAQQQIAVLRSDAAISPVALQELHRITNNKRSLRVRLRDLFGALSCGSFNKSTN